MEDKYYIKYIKYKNKYLYLKQYNDSVQKGGAPIIYNPLHNYHKIEKSKSKSELKKIIAIAAFKLLIPFKLFYIPPPEIGRTRENKKHEDDIEKYLGDIIDYLDINYDKINLEILANINEINKNRLTIELCLIIIVLQLYTNFNPIDIVSEKIGILDRIRRYFKKSSATEYDKNYLFIFNLLSIFEDNQKKYRLIKFLLNPYKVDLESGIKTDSNYTLLDILSIKDTLSFNNTKISDEKNEIKELLNNAILYITNNNNDNVTNIDNITLIRQHEIISNRDSGVF